MTYWPDDLTSLLALCLRRDHTHTPEAGCWIPRPREERIQEADAAFAERMKDPFSTTVQMKDPIFESPEEQT